MQAVLTTVYVKLLSRFPYNDKCPLDVNSVLVYSTIYNGDDVIARSSKGKEQK